MTINEAYDWIWENTNLMQDTLMLDFQCLNYCVNHGILKEIDKEHFESTWTDQERRDKDMMTKEHFENNTNWKMSYEEYQKCAVHIATKKIVYTVTLLGVCLSLMAVQGYALT